MDTLYMVIPAYNEEANIETVVREWYPVIGHGSEQSRMVVINDGSKDDTEKILLGLTAEFPKLTVLTKPNGGHGDTLLFGYDYALKNGADYIFQTDSDGQTRPEEFETFWKHRKKYAMLIGHRKGRQDGASRVFVTKTLKFVCLICFHVKVTDANTPFRIMKAEYLRKALPLIPEHYNLPNVIISVLYARMKYPVKYIPITFRPRQGGVNSINMKKIFGIGRQALKDFRMINRVIKKAEKENHE